MSLIQILSYVSQFLGSGIGVWLVTEVVKRANSIPWIQEGQVARLRAVSGGLSVVAMLVLGLANHNLEPTTIQNALLALVGAASAWAVSHGAHKVLSK